MSASVQDGLRALRRVATHLETGRHAQFIHRYVPVPDTQYQVVHDPDNCGLCANIAVIEDALLGQTVTCEVEA